MNISNLKFIVILTSHTPQKVLIFFLASFCFISCSNSYNSNIERNPGFQYRPGYPEVQIMTTGIVEESTDSTKINLAAEIVYSSLIFKRVDNAFKAGFVIEVQLINEDDPSNIINVKQYPMEIEENNQRKIVSQDGFLFEREYYVKPGNYKIYFTLTDLSNNKQTFRESSAFVPDPEKEVTNLTNIRILSKGGADTNQFKPVTTYDLASTADSVRFSFQITNNKADQPVTILSRLLRFSSDTSAARPLSWPNYNSSNVSYYGIDYSDYDVVSSSSRIIRQPGSVTIEFVFPNLLRGNYRFEVRTDQPEGKELYKAREFSVKSGNYPAIKSTRELANPLIYIMNLDDYEEMMAIDDTKELKKAIDRFWLSSIKKPKVAQNVISLYYQRVEEANKQFSNYKEGWKTDMGMIYILFGPPRFVSNSLDEVVWYYSNDLYNAQASFLFRTPRLKNRFYPFDTFLLVRGQQYYSIHYQQVQKWLNGDILVDNL